MEHNNLWANIDSKSTSKPDKTIKNGADITRKITKKKKRKLIIWLVETAYIQTDQFVRIKIEDKNKTNIFLYDFKIRKNFCHLNKKKVVINKNIVVHKHLCITNSSGPTKDKDLK